MKGERNPSILTSLFLIVSIRKWKKLALANRIEQDIHYAQNN